MKHASTSPFYGIFLLLDVNAKMHEGEAGIKLWKECVEIGIETRKLVLKNCHYIRPLVPESVDGIKWEDSKTEIMYNDIRYWEIDPDAHWHHVNFN